MLKKRIIICLTFLDGILFRTKNFKPDYRYTKNFVDLWSIDELIIIDISKKKFSPRFLELISFFSKNCFVPLSVGGGIQNKKDADLFFKHGADKVLLGNGTFKNSNITKEISMKYGKQSIIQSLDIKKNLSSKNSFFLCTESGDKQTNIDPFEFGQEVLKNGAGEILINNIDNDGSLLGFDIDLIKHAQNKFDCPIIALGGAGNWNHFSDLFIKTDISAACTQNIFHFTEHSILSLKGHLKNLEINIRN